MKYVKESILQNRTILKAVILPHIHYATMLKSPHVCRD